MDEGESISTWDFWRTVAQVWRGLVDAVTPPKCLLCRADVQEPSSLCVACWSKLTLIHDPVCNVMGTPFTYDEGQGTVSAAALMDPPPWDRARSAVAFDDASKEIVHALKYGDRQEAGVLMARQMRRAGAALLAEADIIIPVPLHRWRLWSRRFNQAAFLAQELARANGKPWSGLVLQRVKYSHSQVGLDAASRRKNVARAFRVAPGALAQVAGLRVLLVDDVMTTGATAGACARVLKQAGARTVDVLSFALVLEPKRSHIP